jgi:hypothetical protein
VALVQLGQITHTAAVALAVLVYPLQLLGRPFFMLAAVVVAATAITLQVGLEVLEVAARAGSEIKIHQAQLQAQQILAAAAEVLLKPVAAFRVRAQMAALVW